ncbi:MAG: methylmalonyl-CoA mutase family protein [Thaumarchaeota archaeon]|nr:methylmalonyl-CoA mutase family protein [Nitrososphaerota archaeon]
MKRWEKEVLEPWLAKSPELDKDFQTPSSIKVKRIYTPTDLQKSDYDDLGFPGDYPYTRGVYPTMYRGKPWTMRMFSGFGTPEDTNKRLKYLISHGETGLSIAFDMPTLYGYDADSPRAEGEVGRCGCNISSLKDMETLLDGIPLGKVSTSMTINAPASILTAMYAAVAEKQKVPPKQIRGTVQADMLKEYIAQKEWVYPPEAHMRIIRDMIRFCTREMPNWNYISVSGYHIREAGADAVQELAFTLADGFTYLDLGKEAGLRVEEFAPRISFFFNSCVNFFEEIAKFRAARRIWATVLREKYGVKNPRSLLLRFHTQTSGASLTWQQPLNNIVRTTIEALAAVLGGTQSLHTNSYDEAWALPTEEAVTIALRTQQIIAEETGVTDTIDPLGGSYYVEWLTNEMEEKAYRYFDKIESLGGVLATIKTGFLQREIAETAYRAQKRAEEERDIVVGVNKYAVKEEPPISTLKIDVKAQRGQVKRLQVLRKERDKTKVRKALAELKRGYEDDDANCMYPIMKAVKVYATLGEIVDIGRDVFGEWREPSLV